jgi:hypothetical protein
MVTAVSFLYPRTIGTSRPASDSGVGDAGYSGTTTQTETPQLSGIPASIQMKQNGTPAPAGVGDNGRDAFWLILFQATLGQVLDRDIITDDQGLRYQVFGAAYTALGQYRCMCERLET